MAERRMFAKTIIDSDSFLDMPLSAQALYFHLSMRADDDGFVNNPKKIQRMIGASDDDCKLLIMKQYVLTFESGVIVIKHWKIHNYIQKDRYKETVYMEEKERLALDQNNAYTECIHNVSTLEAQDRIGKVRIGKDSIGEDIDNSIYNNIQEQGGQKGGQMSTRERYKERDKDIEKERIDNNIYNISDQPENSSIPISTTYGLEEFKRDNPQIEMDDYDGTIYSMDFEGLTQRIKESSWLQKVNKFSFFCYKYKKVMAGEYKDRPRKDSYQNEETQQEEPKRIFKTCRI